MTSKLPKHIKEKIIAPIPSSLIKERDGGGGKMLSYISGSTVADMLNNIFEYNWDWEVTKQWIEEGTPYFNTYSKLPAEAQVTNSAGKKGSWDSQAPVCHVLGVLTVRFEDEKGEKHSIRKSGFGSKSIIGKQSEQESIFKAAGTDALKKAASLLGIGLELYRSEEEQMYFNEMNYEDPWTDELKEEFAEYRNYLVSVMEEYELTEELISPYIQEFSDMTLSSIYDIVPDNIVAFCDYMKAKIAESTDDTPAE